MTLDINRQKIDEKEEELEDHSHFCCWWDEEYSYSHDKLIQISRLSERGDIQIDSLVASNLMGKHH